MTVPKLDKRQLLTILGLIGAFLGGDVARPLSGIAPPADSVQNISTRADEFSELKVQLERLETRAEERYLALQDRLSRIEALWDRRAEKAFDRAAR